MVKKIQKVNLCDQLLSAMIELIESGKWPQGSKLPGEIELANSFHVSRNIMREAMKILEGFGILDARNGVGTFVAEDSIENIQNMQFFQQLKEIDSVEPILEFRLMFEPSAAYYAALRITDEQIAEFNEISKKILQKYEQEPEYQDDFGFHLAIARYSGNPFCEGLIASFVSQLRNSLYADFNHYASEKTRKENLIAHTAIIDAITKHNAQLARDLMYDHIYQRLKLINPDFETNPRCGEGTGVLPW